MKSGIQSGATIAMGGEKAEREDGNFFKPTIFDNVKIDNETNVSLDKYINDLKSEIKISNKIIIKNFINDFFKAYSG